MAKRSRKHIKSLIRTVSNKKLPVVTNEDTSFESLHRKHFRDLQRLEPNMLPKQDRKNIAQVALRIFGLSNENDARV